MRKEFNISPLFFWKMWIRVADGDLQDSTRSDLYEYIVDFLYSCSNLDLVWKYADWALRKDPTVGYQDLKWPHRRICAVSQRLLAAVNLM